MFVDDVKGCLKTGSGPVKYDDLLDKPCYYKPKYDAFFFRGVLTDQPKYVSSDGTTFIQLETGKLPAYSELSDYVFWGNGEEYNAKDVAAIPTGGDGSAQYLLALIFYVVLQPTTIADNVVLDPGAYIMLWTDTVPSETKEFRLYKPGSVKKINPSVLPSLYGKVIVDTIQIKPPVSDFESYDDLLAWYKNNYETVEHSDLGLLVKLSDTVLSVDDLSGLSIASDKLGEPVDVGQDFSVVTDIFPAPVVSIELLLWVQEDMNVEEQMMTKGTWTMVNFLGENGLTLTLYKEAKLPNEYLETPIPEIPDTTKNYVLKSIAGTLTWVEETTEASSST